jgi:hypothetical protein
MEAAAAHSRLNTKENKGGIPPFGASRKLPLLPQGEENFVNLLARASLGIFL